MLRPRVSVTTVALPARCSRTRRAFVTTIPHRRRLGHLRNHLHRHPRIRRRCTTIRRMGILVFRSSMLVMTTTAGILPQIIVLRSGFGKPSRVAAMIVVVPSAPHHHPRPRRPRRCSIRTRIIVLRTPIIRANTAGTRPIIYRSGDGSGSRSRVTAILTAVHSVPRLVRTPIMMMRRWNGTIRVRIFVSRTTRT